jgi:DNA-binding MurR/RpiR family transcriptional regulator
MKRIVNKGNCIIKIKGVYNSLKTAEKRLADYILENTEEVIELSMEELGKKANSSYATIFRFCKKIDFSGYKDFKTSLINDVILNKNIPAPIENYLIGKESGTEEICEKIYNFSNSILEDTISMIDVEIIDKAVEKLINAKSILFIGAGTSSVSAKYAYTKFFRLGLNCNYESDPTIFKMKSTILTEKDILFAISSSGRTSSIVDASNLAKKNEVCLISLSDFALSPLTKVSDINLYTTPRNTNLFLNIELPLIIGQITIIDILYSCYCVKLGEKASEFYSKTKLSGDTEKIL